MVKYILFFTYIAIEIGKKENNLLIHIIIMVFKNEGVGVEQRKYIYKYKNSKNKYGFFVEIFR